MSPASFCVFSFDFAIFYVHNLPLLHTSLDNFDELWKKGVMKQVKLGWGWDWGVCRKRHLNALEEVYIRKFKLELLLG